jgi:hypothetical protein
LYVDEPACGPFKRSCRVPLRAHTPQRPSCGSLSALSGGKGRCVDFCRSLSGPMTYRNSHVFPPTVCSAVSSQCDPSAPHHSGSANGLQPVASPSLRSRTISRYKCSPQSPSHGLSNAGDYRTGFPALSRGGRQPLFDRTAVRACLQGRGSMVPLSRIVPRSDKRWKLLKLEPDGDIA